MGSFVRDAVIAVDFVAAERMDDRFFRCATAAPKGHFG
jgi:hypothetical protein